MQDTQINLHLVMKIAQREISLQLFFSKVSGTFNIKLTDHVSRGLSGVALVPSHLREKTKKEKQLF